MPTPKECRQHAAECLKLAKETPQIYARLALRELAAEFREVGRRTGAPLSFKPCEPAARAP
jgi:hypothetical protein